jgi:hypothetical protein
MCRYRSDPANAKQIASQGGSAESYLRCMAFDPIIIDRPVQVDLAKAGHF